MAASPGFRIGAIALLATLVAVLGALLLSGSFDGADAAPAKRTPARQLLLEPTDLPTGFRYFSPDFDGQPNPDVHCAPLRPVDATPEIEEWIEDFAPRACYALFYRFRGHSEKTFEIIPPLVGSGALDAGSTEAAQAGFDLAGLLLTIALDVRVGPPQPAAAGPGEEAVFYRFKSGLVRELSGAGPQTAVLVWRSGDTLGAVLVGGLAAAANDRRALAFARRQQARFR